MSYKEINGTHFNVSAIKSMSLSRFKEHYGVRFGENTESDYFEITGKVKKEKKEKKKDKNEEAPN